VRRLLLSAAIAAMVPSLLAAQGSQFGNRGLGQPGRLTSVKSLASGGAFAPMDELSSLNPASIAGLGAFTASFSGLQGFRTVTNAAGEEAVRESRFPLITIGGPVRNSPLSIGLSLGTYLNRDFAIATQDTVTLRGVPVPVFDTVISKGGVNDFRLAASYRTSKRGSVGLGIHVLSGSTRNELRRTFFDTNYASGRQSAELAFSALGVSVGTVQQFGSRLVVAGSARFDGTLRTDRDSVRASSVSLPMTLNGGLKLRVRQGFDVAASGTYRSWNRADASLVAQGAPGATNTIEGAFGLELATGRNPFSRPLRAGIRYATLPFYVVRGSQPNELGASIGTGQYFGNARAAFDLSLEYLTRKDGTGRRETALVVSAGLSVRP